MLKRSATAGFSLIELMITMTVMAVLLAAVAPSIGSWMVNTRQRSVAEAVLTGLQKARLEAIRRNQTVSFWLVASSDPTQFDATCAPSSTSGSWVISVAAPTGKCSNDPSVKVPEFFSFHAAGKSTSEITISALDASSNAASSLKFDALGVVVASGNPIRTIDFTTATDGARRLRLLISHMGNVRLCDRDATAPDPRTC